MASAPIAAANIDACSAEREPTRTLYPAAAHRVAKPDPAAPVAPITAIVGSFLVMLPPLRVRIWTQESGLQISAAAHNLLYAYVHPEHHCRALNVARVPF